MPVSVTLSPADAAFIEAAVANGQFATPEAAVAAAVDALRSAEHLGALRAALEAGEDSGTPVRFDLEAFLQERRSRFGG